MKLLANKRRTLAALTLLLICATVSALVFYHSPKTLSEQKAAICGEHGGRYNHQTGICQIAR